MASILCRYDTLDLNDEANGLLVSDIDMPDDTRVPMETAARRHGAILSEEPVMDYKLLTIVGSVKKATSDLMRTWIDASLATMNGVQKQFYLHDATRYIRATKSSFDWRWVKGTALTKIEYQCGIFCADPFWYKATPTSDIQVATTHPTTTFSWVHTNNGSAITYPTITITADVSGTISGITLTNVTTGKSFTFGGSIASGTSLVVNCADLTVVNAATNAINSMTGIIALWMVPGSNTITLSGGNATITVAYNDRHYGP